MISMKSSFMAFCTHLEQQLIYSYIFYMIIAVLFTWRQNFIECIA